MNNGQDSTSSSSTESSKSEEGSSCVVQEERKLEELDYLFLVKVKRGEKKMYVNFLLNEDHVGYEGPFDLETSGHQLIKHNNAVRYTPMKIDGNYQRKTKSTREQREL